jgi:tripartite-type tricarboxylate transporter receptor subunit TctC
MHGGLAAELGQPIVTENRAGAGGALGAALVAKATPDGFSILTHFSDCGHPAIGRRLRKGRAPAT